MAILRALGIVIAGYLTWVHYQPAMLTCPSGGLWHCARVLHSAGSAIGPLPLATWGGLWFVAVWMTDHSALWWVRRVLMAAGALGLGWAWSYEWQLQAICLWCTGIQSIIVIQLIVWGKQDMRKSMRVSLHS